ncbi:hypothetical protein [Cognatiluteimonas lumbrici]|uniref:hypothetical protein n=1 Tax=Cognatiluteimonas lumbrici TaxID=2559601 RepID=UPI0011273833|nr:hypothetical protein [Luteimonas lumbrici]
MGDLIFFGVVLLLLVFFCFIAFSRRGKNMFLIGVLSLAPVGAALACADPPKTAFRDIVSAAPNVFVFQVTSASYIREPLGGAAYTEYIVAHIRVVDSLRGDGASFKRIRYSFRNCGSIRMSVGQVYLAATSQSGPELHPWGTDVALLDLTRDHYHEDLKRSPAVDVVKSIIRGEPVPDDFPRDDLVSPLEVYPTPPPPSQR